MIFCMEKTVICVLKWEMPKTVPFLTTATAATIVMIVTKQLTAHFAMKYMTASIHHTLNTQ